MVVDDKIRTRPALLLLEYAVLFFGIIAAYAVLLRGLSPLPFLAVIAVLVTLYLRRTGFDRAAFWRRAAVRAELPSILGLWLVSAVVLAAAVAVLRPERLFDLPREEPLLWLVIVVFYPLGSVYPQELLFRAFLFHRYLAVFGTGRLMVVVSAAAFGFAHIIFGSWISVALSFAAGLLFAERYRRTRSLLTVSIEHALYGILVFTVGLGDFFYHGAVAG